MAPTTTPKPVETLDDFKTPPPADMVLPPKHAQVQIEKLAAFLARRPELYARTFEQAKLGSKNFLCLLETDDYHPFFKWRLEECKAGRSALKDASTTQAVPVKKVEEKPKGPDEPPPYEFSARMPPNISAVDNDTIHLTAQFTAKQGPQWMRQLAQKESANPAFDFLRVQHSYHQYFQRLVDQYSDLLSGKKRQQRLEALEADIEDRYLVLGRAKKRAEWATYQETQKVKLDEEDAKRRLEYSRIDWHDFQIIAKVEFSDADETADLVPSLYLADLQSMSITQKAAATLVSEDKRLDEVMIWDSANWPQAPMPQAPMPQAPVMPAQPPPFYPPPYPPYPMGPVAPGAYPPPGMANPPFQPPPPATGFSHRQPRMVPCPNCGVTYPETDIEAHMKIELMDPDARKQKERADSRYETINRNPDITRTVKKLVGSRPDMHDPSLRTWAGEPAAKRTKY